MQMLTSANCKIFKNIYFEELLWTSKQAIHYVYFLFLVVLLIFQKAGIAKSVQPKSVDQRRQQPVSSPDCISNNNDLLSQNKIRAKQMTGFYLEFNIGMNRVTMLLAVLLNSVFRKKKSLGINLGYWGEKNESPIKPSRNFQKMNM